jgi:hypothetical protein
MDDENEKKNYLLSLNKETLTKIHEKLNTWKIKYMKN